MQLVFSALVIDNIEALKCYEIRVHWLPTQHDWPIVRRRPSLIRRHARPWTIHDGPLRANYCPVVLASYSIAAFHWAQNLVSTKWEIWRHKFPSVGVYFHRCDVSSEVCFVGSVRMNFWLIIQHTELTTHWSRGPLF